MVNHASLFFLLKVEDRSMNPAKKVSSCTKGDILRIGDTFGLILAPLL